MKNFEMPWPHAASGWHESDGSPHRIIRYIQFHLYQLQRPMDRFLFDGIRVIPVYSVHVACVVRPLEPQIIDIVWQSDWSKHAAAAKRSMYDQLDGPNQTLSE